MSATTLVFLTVFFALTFTAHAILTGANHAMPESSHLKTKTDTKSGKQTFNPTVSPSASKTVQAASPTYLPTYILPTPTIFPTYMSMPTSQGKSGKTGGKTGKGSVPSSSSNLCEKRFDLAWEANANADFIIANNKDEMKARCGFDTTNTKSSPFAPNLSCPFIFTPKTGFLDTESEVVAYFNNITGTMDQSIGQAFWLFQLYCQCQQGYDLGCSSKIPHGPPSKEMGYVYGSVHVSSYSEFIPASTPAERAEYCALAGIWNGDFDLDNFFDLPKDVQECGCFWVGEAQEMVDDCPGVDLGAFFIDPTGLANLTNMVNSMEHVGTSWRQNLTLIMAGKWGKL